MTDHSELILRGAEERLAPIMMTALTTGLAFVPLVVTGEIPGQEIEHPMGLVILCGVATATIVNLVILPVVCSFAVAGDASPQVKPLEVLRQSAALTTPGRSASFDVAQESTHARFGPEKLGTKR